MTSGFSTLKEDILTEALNPQTFDVSEMFAGISYPTEQVPFYTDSKVAYEFNKLSKEAADAVVRKDEEASKDIEKRHEALIKQAEANRYIIHLRGQSRDNRQAILNAVRAEFPAEKDFLGRETIDPQADEIYINRIWALHIERIERPDGAILLSDEAAIKILRGNSPDSELAKIERAIQELSEGAKSGFESLAQEHDFLSSASPEA